jgi:hypothetical protein
MKALCSRVLVVAVIETEVRDWAAYIDAVPGENHAQEVYEVADHGCKLSRELAEFLFPDIAEQFIWRD